MHKWIIGLIVSITLVSCNSDNKDTNTSTPEKKTQEFNFQNPDIKEELKISYAIGYKYAEATRELDLSKESQKHFMMGIKKFFKSQSLSTPDDITIYARKIDKIVQEKRSAKLKEEIKKGKKYTAQILTTEEYQTSTSGLIYKIEKQGNTGTNLSKTPYLQMNYIASKISGKQYESTMNGDPRIIHKNGLLKAWLEAFKIAGKGGIIEVIAPPSLTYGNNGALPRVQPGEYIIFKINFFKTFIKHPNKR